MSTLRELELAQVAPRLLELLRRQGFGALTAFQADSVNEGIMRDESQILVTNDYDEAYVVAEIAVLNKVASDFRAKTLVLCPNPHHAEKRYQSISQKCRRMGIEATEIIRQRTAVKGDWGSGRVIVATYRAMDIAVRNNPNVLEGVECVLIDRLDLIGQPGLGARLERVIVSLMGRADPIQYIAICPPVADVPELSHWLNARAVEDKKAEVKMIFSVRAFDSVNESLADLTEFVHYRRGQVMILCANIPACEDLARRLAGLSEGEEEVTLDLRLVPEHKDDLLELARDVKQSYAECDMTSLLGTAISRGVGFLHEGVSRTQRRRISNAWEDGIIPVAVMPTRFAIASGLRATVVFLLGVFMQELGKELTQEDSVTMLSEWQLNDVLQSAGRRGLDREAFGIVVVDNEQERTRVMSTYFDKDPEGNLSLRHAEVDSVMDDPDNIQDLVLGQICGRSKEEIDPYSIIDRTYWATSKRTIAIPPDGSPAPDDASVEQLVTLRSTKSTEKRAQEIPDESVRLVSLNPSKIEGLVHSGSREMWHYVSLRSADGVSCSCESWKYQGIRRHRLCKHLVKFTKYALQQDKTKPYAPSVIEQSLRGLETIGELEKDGLVRYENKKHGCTELGEAVTLLGVPVRDAKKVMDAIDKGKADLKRILLGVSKARGSLPKGLLARVLDSLPADNIDSLVCKDSDLPGIVENCLEDLDYTNLVLQRLMKDKRRAKMKRESVVLEKSFLTLLKASR